MYYDQSKAKLISLNYYPGSPVNPINFQQQEGSNGSNWDRFWFLNGWRKRKFSTTNQSIADWDFPNAFFLKDKKESMIDFKSERSGKNLIPSKRIKTNKTERIRDSLQDFEIENWGYCVRLFEALMTSSVKKARSDRKMNLPRDSIMIGRRSRILLIVDIGSFLSYWVYQIKTIYLKGILREYSSIKGRR